jgi:hypothetical protein
MRGFFLSPDRQLVAVPATHIQAVIADPATFGTSAQQIADAYQRHGEIPPSEQSARAEILGAILEAAPWLRIREQTRQHGGGWHLQLHTGHPQATSQAVSFAAMALQGTAAVGAASWPQERCCILDARGTVRWTGTLGGLVADPPARW